METLLHADIWYCSPKKSLFVLCLLYHCWFLFILRFNKITNFHLFVSPRAWVVSVPRLAWWDSHIFYINVSNNQCLERREWEFPPVCWNIHFWYFERVILSLHIPNRYAKNRNPFLFLKSFLKQSRFSDVPIGTKRYSHRENPSSKRKYNLLSCLTVLFLCYPQLTIQQVRKTNIVLDLPICHVLWFSIDTLYFLSIIISYWPPHLLFYVDVWVELFVSPHIPGILCMNFFF